MVTSIVFGFLVGSIFRVPSSWYVSATVYEYLSPFRTNLVPFTCSSGRALPLDSPDAPIQVPCIRSRSFFASPFGLSAAIKRPATPRASHVSLILHLLRKELRIAGYGRLCGQRGSAPGPSFKDSQFQAGGFRHAFLVPGRLPHQL